jgi:hypothetical protein
VSEENEDKDQHDKAAFTERSSLHNPAIATGQTEESELKTDTRAAKVGNVRVISKYEVDSLNVQFSQFVITNHRILMYISS